MDAGGPEFDIPAHAISEISRALAVHDELVGGEMNRNNYYVVHPKSSNYSNWRANLDRIVSKNKNIILEMEGDSFNKLSPETITWYRYVTAPEPEDDFDENWMPTGTELEVCKDIAARQKRGIKKYKTTVMKNKLTLREWLVHSYQEKLDDIIYMKRAIEEIDNTSDLDE